MAFRILSFLQKDSSASISPTLASKILEPQYLLGASDLPEFVRNAEVITPEILKKIVLNGLIRLEKEGLSPFESQATKK